MEPHETVLSEVHMYTDNLEKQCSLSSSRRVSRLVFFDNNNEHGRENRPMQGRLDDDGDADVVRRSNRSSEVITLEHTLATPLSLVGLQLWNGALLMADFILHFGPNLHGCAAVELGSGIGFCSILLGMFAETVFCTDVGDEILSLCKRNIEYNSYLIGSRSSGHRKSVVHVKELDWFRDDMFTSVKEKWTWTEDEKRTAKETIYLFASDVIYRDDITDAFFSTVVSLMKSRPDCSLFLSIEKRLNFSLSDLDVSSPAYDHFETWIKKLQTGFDGVNWTVRRLRTDYPQCFKYERTKYLELWKIESTALS